MDANKPPATLDGARVLWWAWSGEARFGVVEYSDGGIAAEIYGLAICKYEDSEVFYRFSCNRMWEVVTDEDYNDSPAEAMSYLPLQYTEVPARWVKYEETLPDTTMRDGLQ